MGEQKLRAALYARVSTLEQAREGYSIEGQQERLQAFAVSKDYIAYKPYVDPGYSGGNTDRPALKAMIRDIKAGLIDVVVVYKLDRLSRRQKDTLHLIEDVLLPHGVHFVSVSESLDTATPYGRAMIGILSAFAQLEREQIRERTILGRTDRAKSGLWHGGGGPARMITGYDYDDGLLVKNDYEAAAVQYMFDRYCAGHGIGSIFAEVKRKWPGVINAESTLTRILRNPVYTGKIKFNKKFFPGLHEPLITEEQFKKTQELRKRRTNGGENFKSSYLLSGLMYCGLCGARMSGRTGGRMKNGNTMKYYGCYSRQKSLSHMVKDPTCTKTYMRKEKIESMVLEHIMGFKTKEIEETAAESQNKNELAGYEKELNEVTRQLDRLVDLYAMGTLPAETISKKSKELSTKRESILEEIQFLEQEDFSNVEEIKETISKLHQADWNSLEIEEQRLMVGKLINRITLTNDDVTIEWAFQSPT